MRHLVLILLTILATLSSLAKNYKNTPLPTVLHNIETSARGELIINFAPHELSSYRVTLDTDGLTPLQAVYAAIEHLPVKITVNGRYVTLQHTPMSVIGRVTDTKGESVENALVEAIRSDSRKAIGSALTNADGSYHFNVSYRGNVTIYVNCLGYLPDTLAGVTDRPLLVRLNTRPTVLDGVGVSDKAIPLRNIEVNAAAVRNIRLPQTGRATIDASQVLAMPVIFGEPDIVKSLQQQSGVAQGVEGFTGLYVHGGNNDQNMFVYEGLPLYHVSHLGGLFSAFNVNTVKNADFYKSYFPSRFGGRLSSVTDITTNTPDFEHWHGRLSIGLISGNAYITGPIKPGCTAFTAGVRRTWADLITTPAIWILNQSKKEDGQKSIFHYAFTDINLRVDHKLSSRLSARLTGYFGHDALKIGDKNFDPNAKSDYSRLTQDYLKWGNSGAIASIVYSGSNYILGADAYYSRYSSDYTQTYESNSSTENEAVNYNLTRSNTRNSVTDIGAHAYYDARWGNYGLRAGADFIRHRFNPEEYSSEKTTQNSISQIISDTPLSTANEASLHLDNEINIGQHITFNVGTRYTTFATHDDTHQSIEPRGALSLIISDRVSVKAGYSRMTQYVQQIARNYTSLPTDFYQPIPTGFKPLQSDHYSGGVYVSLPNGWYGNAEGWYRTMDNLLEYREGVNIFNDLSTWSDKLTSGRGWAYGTDISVTKSAGRVTGTAAYGLMWNWRKFAELNGGRKFPAQFDNRHKINLSAEYQLNDRIRFNASWTYMTGNRITLAFYEYRGVAHQFPDSPYGDGLALVLPEQIVEYYPERNNFRLPAYHRLDIGMTLTQNHKNGRKGIWTFGIYNAYNHLNAITIKKDVRLKDTYAVGPNIPMQNINYVFRVYSLLPILPSVSYTYVF